MRIDVHHHVLPPRFVERTPMPGPMPSLEARLEWMDRLDIQTAFTSLTPRVFLGYPEDLRGVARACNEYQAQLVADYPGRFGAFATLPLPDVDGALEEVAYALDVLRLDGVGLFSSVEGTYLGNPAFDPLFDELQRRRCVVFVHPAHATTPAELGISAFDATIEYGFDTTRAIVNLLHTGTFQRCPATRFIFSHAGGAAPFLARRISWLRADAIPVLQGLYYDTASCMGPYALRSLQALVEPSHILWGTDIPFLFGQRLLDEVAEWQAYDGLVGEQRRGVEELNARGLFERLASKVP